MRGGRRQADARAEAGSCAHTHSPCCPLGPRRSWPMGRTLKRRRLPTSLPELEATAEEEGYGWLLRLHGDQLPT